MRVEGWWWNPWRGPSMATRAQARVGVILQVTLECTWLVDRWHIGGQIAWRCFALMTNKSFVGHGVMSSQNPCGLRGGLHDIHRLGQCEMSYGGQAKFSRERTIVPCVIWSQDDCLDWLWPIHIVVWSGDCRPRNDAGRRGRWNSVSIGQRMRL